VSAGEAVYALADFWRDGSDAEYIAIAALDLAPKPRTLDFTQAAAAPLSALTAWQALFDDGRLAAGQKVLIHGATAASAPLPRPLERRIYYRDRFRRKSRVRPRTRRRRGDRLHGSAL
jgi:hypothetical protein